MTVRTLVFALIIGLCTVASVRADQITTDQGDPIREGKPPSIVVPYAFSTEALETGLGAVFFSLRTVSS